MKTLEEIRIE